MTQSFTLPKLCSKNDIWGPSSLPEDLEIIPYLGFTDNFNYKVADSFLGDIPDKKTYHADGGEEYISNQSNQRGQSTKKRFPANQTQFPRKDFQPFNETHQTNEIPRFTKKTSKKTKLEQNSKEKKLYKSNKQRPMTRKNDVKIRRIYSKLEASLKVASNWEKMIELEFPFLIKLKAINEVTSVVDLCFAGSVGVLDYSFDRLSSKKTLNLRLNSKTYSNRNIILDPVIQNLSEDKTANVFATDIALALLMCSPGSTSTWDIQVLKWENVIYLFSQMNPYKTAVDETFNLPTAVPFESTGINSVQSLYEESFRVQWSFASQIIRQTSGRAYSSDANSESSEGYRYRKFTLQDETSVVVRFQLDAVNSPLTSNKLDSNLSYSLVRSFLEWHPTLEMNWRQLIDIHKPSIVMNSVACNTCAVAQWALTCKLGGFDSVKFGMVSRRNMKSASEHVILGTHQLEVGELCGQISLDEGNCWAILKCVLKLFAGYEDGLYHIIKDPNKSSIFLYKRPNEDLATINS